MHQANLFPDYRPSGSDRDLISVITLYQPWATFVILGWKRIETREHARFACLAGSRIAIHAGKKWDPAALDACALYLTPQQRALATGLEATAPRGAILGLADVDSHRRLKPQDAAGALIECATPRFGLFLAGVEPLAVPLAMPGGRGIWKIERSRLRLP